MKTKKHQVAMGPLCTVDLNECMKSDNNEMVNLTEDQMLESIRKRFMFVDVVQLGNGIKSFVISHKSSRTIAEFCSEDTVRMNELASLYGL